jgi:hypothetical protein
MESMWNSAKDNTCRFSESTSVDATLAAGLRFERVLGWTLWVALVAVLVWGSN